MRYLPFFPALTIFLLASGCTKPEPDELIEPGPTQVMFSDRVTDLGGQPVEGVVLSLWTSNSNYQTETDGNGKYHLILEEDLFPRSGEIAMTLYKSGYEVQPLIYATPLTTGTTYRSGGPALASCQSCLEVTTPWGDAYELFHLGDGSYQGSANSQFQKGTDSEWGIEFAFFTASAQPLEIAFMAKGIQFSCNANTINLNGATGSIDPSPEDGSYQQYRFTGHSQAGENSVTLITSTTCNGTDRDDWEFVGFTVKGL
ncbi:hypothetical protein CLV84_0199 [Neolewinella xylanilytica]|uniref:Carboxypeptidase family protein n=1 Tax=Neolewinella xylanilytica TaxID=1514080 RepID=A0A2S6I6Y9_9BACT|nr:carboxypeptidase-like regulatory domain-containing protein [Neolewinella xylanilytica]PPK87261.1 hypothetical protein CLV84_0199 [Neolewinella xylanilytica]